MALLGSALDQRYANALFLSNSKWNHTLMYDNFLRQGHNFFLLQNLEGFVCNSHTCLKRFETAILHHRAFANVRKLSSLAFCSRGYAATTLRLIVNTHTTSMIATKKISEEIDENVKFNEVRRRCEASRPPRMVYA